ncbi:MAG: hypothetical protein WBA44_05155 [Mesorhizobium sp.]
MKVEIKRIEAKSVPMGTSAIVAEFDAIVGDFHIRQASLRRNYGDLTYFVGFGGGGKKRTGITLPRHCETRAAILAAAVEALNVRS